jgi:hypothetical protein
MDNLFTTRTLTTSINKMGKAGRRMFQRHFAPKLRYSVDTQLAFDIITGNQGILGNISVHEPAPIGKKTGRATVTLEAPRIAEKRIIHVAEINKMRAYGAMGSETMKSRIAREQYDLRMEFDRTLEYWASQAIRGKILDADLTTVLVDYGLPATHNITLVGADLFTDPASKIINTLRAWKQLLNDDSQAEITGYQCWCGNQVMDALLDNTKVLELMKYTVGAQIARHARIAELAEISFDEYTGSFVHTDGTRKRFLAEDEILLIGEGPDVFDCPYTSQLIETLFQRGQAPPLFYSKSWNEEDPEGKWIYGETRPLPVLKRPECVIVAKAV